jgi:secreted PhoX family phosphatase
MKEMQKKKILSESLAYLPKVIIKHHLIVCEDQYTDKVDNHLKRVTPTGHTYDFARVRLQTEPAGACFSPYDSTLFVNLYSPTTTLAITGPWEKFIS